MKRKHAALILATILLTLGGYYLFFAREPGPAPDAAGPSRAEAVLQQQPLPPDDEGERTDAENKPAPTAYHPKDIEGIKKQIYDLNIEDVDDIPLLDSVVQTGKAPTRDFWQGGWTSVDDFKEEANGFRLEPQDDGTFVFYPDENTTKTYTFFETPRTYSYDPVKKEFFWEMDYYGKAISHRVRFINDNVVAMMLVSGRKVTMEIYQKQPEKQE